MRDLQTIRDYDMEYRGYSLWEDDPWAGLFDDLNNQLNRFNLKLDIIEFTEGPGEDEIWYKIVSTVSDSK